MTLSLYRPICETAGDHKHAEKNRVAAVPAFLRIIHFRKKCTQITGRNSFSFKRLVCFSYRRKFITDFASAPPIYYFIRRNRNNNRKSPLRICQHITCPYKTGNYLIHYQLLQQKYLLNHFFSYIIDLLCFYISAMLAPQHNNDYLFYIFNQLLTEHRI